MPRRWLRPCGDGLMLLGLFNFADEPARIVLDDGDIAVLNTLNIPTGAANPDLAHEFINFVLDADNGQQMIEDAGYIPLY